MKPRIKVITLAVRDLEKSLAFYPASPSEFSIGHIVNSKQEVDEIILQAERAGAKITDPPHDRFWGGYSGYFQDLDRHLWEIAWNPQWVVEE